MSYSKTIGTVLYTWIIDTAPLYAVRLETLHKNNNYLNEMMNNSTSIIAMLCYLYMYNATMQSCMFESAWGQFELGTVTLMLVLFSHETVLEKSQLLLTV